MNEGYKLRSSIRTSLMRFVLMKGTAIALIGALLLLYGGIFLPVDVLSIWGFPLMLAGGGLIAAGLLPYRLLSRLERKPDELIVNTNELILISQGRPCLTIPCQSIARTAYIEYGRCYGIAIWLKTPIPEKVIVHTSRFPKRYQKNTHKYYDCTLFLPYFTERSFTTLQTTG